MHGLQAALHCINAGAKLAAEISRAARLLDQAFVGKPFLNSSAIWPLFLSIISIWEFPLMPTSGKLTTSTLPPAARTASA